MFALTAEWHDSGDYLRIANSLVDLGLFLGVAIVVGWLVDRLRSARASALDAARRERDAREELDRLVATVTHDLATPLTAIQGTLQFVRKHAALSEVDLARLLVRIETAAARATSLVKALSDRDSIARQSLSLELPPVDLRRIVEPIVTMLDRPSDRHPIALAMEATPLVVNGDADRLARVVENLITNAIKYSPGGGAIEVELRGESGGGLTVRDHGIGIPTEARDQLFDLGFRAPEAAGVAPGLGLGLYTSSELIRRHAGTIGVTAPEGGGAMFTVRFPLARRSQSEEPTRRIDEVTTSSPSRAVH